GGPRAAGPSPGQPGSGSPGSLPPSLGRGGAPAVIPIAGLQQVRPELLAASEQVMTVQQVNALIADAVRRRATDIHFEAREEGLQVRCRVDGLLHPLAAVPRPQAEVVMTRALVMNGLNPGQSSGSTTGRCEGRVD